MRIVLTGPPHAGKTTLLRALAEQGCRTVPEAALAIIDEHIARDGLKKTTRWRKAHPAAFQVLVAHKQLEQEAALPTDAVCFLDRGVHDGLAYCAQGGFVPPGVLFRLAEQTRYDKVILCELIEPFAPRSGTGRTSGRERALALQEGIEAAYTHYGMAPVRLPQQPLAERVAAVLELATRP